MTFKISKDFYFSASHQLDRLASWHPCSRLHGHNYQVRVVLRASELDDVGFVLDYGDLAAIRDWIDATLDHQHLNDQVPLNPTAENLAWLLAGKVRELVLAPAGETRAIRVGVGVSETPRTWAWYEEP